MKISFNDIPTEGLSLLVDYDHWFPDDLLLKKYESATILLKRYDQRVTLEGAVSVVVTLECDRCQDTCDFPVKSEFKIDFELESVSDLSEIDVDHHCQESQIDIVVLSDAEIDIHHVLEQQVYLALPMKRLCSEKCKGVCMRCGLNLNRGKCQCRPDSESPFDVLAKLQI